MEDILYKILKIPRDKELAFLKRLVSSDVVKYFGK